MFNRVSEKNRNSHERRFLSKILLKTHCSGNGENLTPPICRNIRYFLLTNSTYSNLPIHFTHVPFHHPPFFSSRQIRNTKSPPPTRNKASYKAPAANATLPYKLPCIATYSMFPFYTFPSIKHQALNYQQ